MTYSPARVWSVGDEVTAALLNGMSDQINGGAWAGAALAGGWGTASGYLLPQWRQLPDGTVQLRGASQYNTTMPNPTMIATGLPIPYGSAQIFEPVALLASTGTPTSTAGWANMRSDGGLRIYYSGGTPAIVVLDGVTWSGAA